MIGANKARTFCRFRRFHQTGPPMATDVEEGPRHALPVPGQQDRQAVAIVGCGHARAGNECRHGDRERMGPENPRLFGGENIGRGVIGGGNAGDNRCARLVMRNRMGQRQLAGRRSADRGDGVHCQGSQFYVRHFAL